MRRVGIVGAVLFGLLVTVRFATSGTNTLSSVSGGRVQTSHVNQFYTALNQDVVPRNSSGAPTNVGGSLGSSTYAWLKAWVESGYWSAGDIKMHHTYNGTVGCGQGWMLADGDVINETNYDAEHGAGSWDTYVVSSPLDGKYLPNFNGKYATGANTTTQAGTIAITSVGNASNVVNIAHTHTADHAHDLQDHGHLFLDQSSTTGGGRQSDLSTFKGFTSAVYTGSNTGLAVCSGSQAVSAGCSGVAQSGFYTNTTRLSGGGNLISTETESLSTSSSLSSSQSIRPESIEVQFCMRVIE